MRTGPRPADSHNWGPTWEASLSPLLNVHPECTVSVTSAWLMKGTSVKFILMYEILVASGGWGPAPRSQAHHSSCLPPNAALFNILPRANVLGNYEHPLKCSFSTPVFYSHLCCFVLETSQITLLGEGG